MVTLRSNESLWLLELYVRECRRQGVLLDLEEFLAKQDKFSYNSKQDVRDYLSPLLPIIFKYEYKD